MNYSPAPPIKWNRSIGWNLDRRNMEITQRIYDGCDCYPWSKTFVIWPRRTITGKPLFWQWAYKRKFWAVWGTGFHLEPHVEYAMLFEIIADDRPK